MGGFTALNPWYLVGLAGALVPLVIHLIERRRVQRVMFGSVWFLRGLVRRVARRRRTSELILLVLRMVILGLLALAFSRPFFRSGAAAGESGGGTGRRAAAILVDCSASMKIGTRMADAVKQALTVIDGLHAGDHVAVYAYGTRLETAADWTPAHDAARLAVNALKPTDQGTDLVEALRQVGDIVAARPEPTRDITVCSDMQAGSWETYTGDWQLHEGISLTLPPGTEAKTPANIGIVKLAVPVQAVVGSEPDVLTAQVRNYTDARRDITVSLELQRTVIDTRKLSIGPDSATAVSFRHTFDAPGEVTGRFVLEAGDAFPSDDRASFVIRVKPKIKVVLVNGSDDPDPKSNDGYFLRRAFAPSRESIFQVTEVTPGSFADAALDDTGVVVLADVVTLDEEALKRLRTYVQGGGGVIFFPGTQTRPSTFNTLFGDVAPCLLEERLDVMDRGEHRRGLVITEVDQQHPIFQPFSGPHHGDFSRVSFRSYFSVSNSQAATVLARFDNMKPAVLIKKIGKGVSLLMVSSADLEMNDLCLRAVFLPFVHQSARLLAAVGEERERSVPVGAEVVTELPAAAASARLTTPSGESKELTATKRDGAGGTSTPASVVRFVAEEQGIYKVACGDAEQLFAANVDPAEGNLLTLQPDEVAAALTSRRGTTGGDGASLHVEARTLRDEDVEHAQKIGWMLLILVTGLLAVEMVLADRITARD